MIAKSPRKASRNALNDAKRLASFPQLNPNPVIELNIDGDVRYINESGKKTFPDLVAKGHTHPLLANWKKLVDKLKNEPSGHLTREVKAGARYYHLTLIYDRIEDSVRIYALDFTERKQLENELISAKQRLDDQINNSPLAIIEFDSEFHIIRWSDEAQNMFGWAADEVTGKQMNDLPWIYEEDLELVEIESRNLFSAKTPRSVNTNRNVRKDGSVIWCEWYDSATYDSNGNLVSVLSQVLDVTKRRQAEEALRASEGRVRKQLDGLLAPEGDIGDVELADIVDAASIQALVNDFYAISGIPMALIDLKGEVVVGVGWQDICTRFHRINEETCRSCVESDVHLTEGIPAGEFKLYRCKNGMWDMATPIIIGGKHMGNLFCGQFFFDYEPVDRAFFVEQAARYGFPEDEYLTALDKVPRITRAELDLTINFYQKLAENISKLSYNNIMLARLLFQRDELTEALKRSEDRLNRAQEIAKVGSWELDLVRNILTWSDEVFRIFGLKPQEFTATYEAFLEGVHPDDRATVDDAYTRSLSEGRDAYEVQHRVVNRATGEVRFVEEKCQHFRNQEGRVVRSVGMVQDITERKRADDFMHSQLRILTEANTSVQYLNDMLQIFLDECESLTGSQIGFCHFVDEDQETLLLQSWSTNTLANACTAEGRDSHYPVADAGVWAECVRTRGPVIHNDYASLANRKGLPAGHVAVVRELVIPIVNNNIIVAIFGVGNKPTDYDETDVEALTHLGNLSWEMIKRKRTEEELRLASVELAAANDELQAFAYSVSHDLRAPLRTLDGFSQALLEDYRDKLDATGIDYLNRLRAGSQRMAALIDELLKLSRMTRDEMTRRPVDLTIIAGQIAAGLIAQSPERQVKLDIEPKMVAEGDAKLLAVALENLIGNAWKFTSQTDQARIEVGSTEKNGKRTFFVRDNGVGFDMKYADKLFGPFQRLHKAAEFPGNGIGLATVQRIIHRHGGEIWAASAPGEGAMFSFTL